MLPINLVSKKGYKQIIVLRTYSLGIKRHVNQKDLNIISISPAERLSSTMDFSKKSARKNLKMGYEDAVNVLERLL